MNKLKLQDYINISFSFAEKSLTELSSFEFIFILTNSLKMLHDCGFLLEIKAPIYPDFNPQLSSDTLTERDT